MDLEMLTFHRYWSVFLPCWIWQPIKWTQQQRSPQGTMLKFPTSNLLRWKRGVIGWQLELWTFISSIIFAPIEISPFLEPWKCKHFKCAGFFIRSYTWGTHTPAYVGGFVMRYCQSKWLTTFYLCVISNTSPRCSQECTIAGIIVSNPCICQNIMRIDPQEMVFQTECIRFLYRFSWVHMHFWLQ